MEIVVGADDGDGVRILDGTSDQRSVDGILLSLHGKHRPTEEAFLECTLPIEDNLPLIESIVPLNRWSWQPRILPLPLDLTNASSSIAAKFFRQLDKLDHILLDIS